MLELKLTTSPFILGAVVIIILLTIFWALRFNKNTFYSGNIRTSIILLRLTAILIFLLFLCDFQLTRRYYREEGPSLAFVWDFSESMKNAAETPFRPQQILDSPAYRSLSKAAGIEHIAGMENPQVISEKSLRKKEFDESFTNLGKLLDFAVERTKYDYLVLISDGQSYLGELPQQIRIPQQIKLFCIGVGDTAVQAVPALHALKIPSYLKEKDTAAFSWILENPSKRELRGDLLIIKEKDTLYREALELAPGRYRSQKKNIGGLADGNHLLHWYFISESDTTELRAANIRVHPSRIRILCDSGMPDPDIAMVRTLLSAESEFVLYDRVRWKELYAGEKPDLLIQTWHPQREIQYIEDVPAILFFRGEQYSQNTGEMEVAEYRSYLMYNPNPDVNAALWKQLPPLTIYEYQNGSRSVLKSENAKSVISEDPEGRRIIITASGLWRWHLAAYEKNWSGLYKNMLKQMIRELLKNREKQFIAFEYDYYEALQYLPLNAALQHDNTDRIELSRSRVSLSLLDSNFAELRREDHAAGSSIRPEFSTGDTGRYYLLARLFTEGREIERDTATVRVLPYNPENAAAGLDKNALLAMSRENGGKFFYLKDFYRLQDNIPKEKISRLHTRVFKSRNIYFLAVLIIALLSAEWIIRKRAGGI